MRRFFKVLPLFLFAVLYGCPKAPPEEPLFKTLEVSVLDPINGILFEKVKVVVIALPSGTKIEKTIDKTGTFNVPIDTTEVTITAQIDETIYPGYTKEQKVQMYFEEEYLKVEIKFVPIGTIAFPQLVNDRTIKIYDQRFNPICSLLAPDGYTILDVFGGSLELDTNGDGIPEVLIVYHYMGDAYIGSIDGAQCQILFSVNGENCISVMEFGLEVEAVKVSKIRDALGFEDNLVALLRTEDERFSSVCFIGKDGRAQTNYTYDGELWIYKEISSNKEIYAIGKRGENFEFLKLQREEATLIPIITPLPNKKFCEPFAIYITTDRDGDGEKDILILFRSQPVRGQVVISSKTGSIITQSEPPPDSQCVSSTLSTDVLYVSPTTGCYPLTVNIKLDVVREGREEAEAIYAGETLTVKIDFGDGYTILKDISYGRTEINHVYNEPGVYTLIVDIPSINFSKSVELEIQNCYEMKLSVEPQSGCYPLSVTLKGELNVVADEVMIDFGDGATTTIENVSTFSITHTYSEPGTYTVKATYKYTEAAVEVEVKLCPLSFEKKSYLKRKV